jgi:uncharacterized protein YjiS (DUF1127 family)
MSNRLLFRQPALARPHALLASPTQPAWTAIRAAWRRYRSRQRIVDLDSHLLKDIGVSFAEAEAEANQPFWRE